MPSRKRVTSQWDDDFDDEFDDEEDDDNDDEDDESEDVDDDDVDYAGSRGGYGWGYFPRSKPRKVEGGIKSRSTGRGKFGESWWAQKWIGLLDSFGWSNRLQRGRSYARGGQVLNIRIQRGEVAARVQGSQRTPYQVHIGLEALNDQEWTKAIAAMSAEAGFAARLLAGEMPQNIEEAFAAAKVSLLPKAARDIGSSCSCPDPANPCKHIAAVHYILAEQFDTDPFIIFQLRGRSREQVLSALRAQPGATTKVVTAGKARKRVSHEFVTPEEAEPLAAQMENFWTVRESVDALRFSVAAPPVEAALLKRLGQPPFWRGPHDFNDTLMAAYAAVTAAALEAA